MALVLDHRPRSFGTVWVTNTGDDYVSHATCVVVGAGFSHLPKPSYIAPGETKIIAKLDGTHPTIVALVTGTEPLVEATFLPFEMARAGRRRGGR